MPRKIFLSFLGTNNYEPVSYWIERSAENAPLEKYVQKTILNHLAPDFTAEDHAYIFLTDEARAANWENDGHYDFKTKQVIPNTGLAQQVEAEAYAFGVSPIPVDGESEPEAIWATFERVYECIQPGDEVYLDITHSWRYLPMLGMTLLNYAKVLKQITVKAIYYGAFEQLGMAYEVRQMPMEERPVPVLDLVSFSDLQDWTVAADDFVEDGNPARLAELTRKNITPILSQSKGQDAIARNLRDITHGLDGLVKRISTNRGRQIWEYNFDALHDSLNAFSKEQSYIKPLNGVIEHIKSKVLRFRHAQWLEAVHWCIQHQLVPQGITQLQEGVITWLCNHYAEKGWGEPDYFNPYHNGKGRDLISRALQFIDYTPPEEEWRGQIGRYKALGYRVMEDDLAQAIASPFSKLAKARNDINHGGYTKTSRAEGFYRILQEAYEAIRKELMPYLEQEVEGGLINLSNHPSDKWPAEQLQAAREQYGYVRDIPFPAINPNMEAIQMQALVQEYFETIQSLTPTAVHLMGEMTFTFALVQKLKAAGIPCVASTSHRKVEERDGKKIVQFEFVQFRPY
ncbi:MAG: TIGR02221 family CRISPR-associated protein [Bacteroidetes bacterium]|jgi:CRISPR-associated Csx2 family protein|nr:TIGR02221 family CRISPR-associated protein [Bacteroidota bacterium]